MAMFRACAVMLCLGALSSAVSGATPKSCDTLLPDSLSRRQPRDVTPEDLATLRDIGRPDSDAHGSSPISLSPKGDYVGFILQRPNIAENGFCRALVLAPVRGRGKPRIVDDGGEPILQTSDNYRGQVFPSGLPAIITPSWSPDGKRIAYLRREKGRRRIRIVDIDSGKAWTLDRPADDVEDVAWSGTGDRLIVATRPALAEAQRAIDQEGLKGYYLDNRVMPLATARPYPRTPIPYLVQSLDMASGALAPARPQEAARLEGPTADLAVRSHSPGGWTIALKPVDPDHYPSPNALIATSPERKAITCTLAICRSHIADGWWDDDRHILLFLKREGWANSELGLYSWKPGASRARRIFRSADTLIGCRLSAQQLVCLEDGSQKPRRLVAIDVRSGHDDLLFDTNPEFADLRLGSVERLHWKTGAGVEGFGDLVLPPGHKPGDRHPMVVVQYRTRGFLRGGTGDEYPIFALAAKGIAVLSFETPPDYATDIAKRTWADFFEASREDMRNWNQRRAILDSLLKGVDTALASGAIDPDRIGLSGLSDGTTTAQFALVNSQIFKALAVSTPLEDTHSWTSLGGEAFWRVRQKMGYPSFTADAPSFWKAYALTLNADRINTPILMQLPDMEYLGALETYWTLKDKDKPVEIHVFPQEYHIKWQPAHRLAIYRRNIDWFAYWLQDFIDPAPEKADQYRRWTILKAQRDKAAQMGTGPATKSRG